MNAVPCSLGIDDYKLAGPAEIVEFCNAEPEPTVEPDNITTLGLIELILKDRPRLLHLLRSETASVRSLPRLLAISLAGFVLFGVAMSIVLTATNRWPSLTPLAEWAQAPRSSPVVFKTIQSHVGRLAPWINGEALVLTLAYAFGLVAASGVCLPSLYFYGLLAGVRMSMLDVVVHAVKSKAVAAVALVGILPIYVAAAMGVIIFDGGPRVADLTLVAGLLLPFFAGLWGTASLYQGFAQLCDTMPPERRCRRACFLRRLVLSWSACYSAVMPVMIYSLWEVFSRV
jgi:hypothetical protein